MMYEIREAMAWGAAGVAILTVDAVNVLEVALSTSTLTWVGVASATVAAVAGAYLVHYCLDRLEHIVGRGGRR